MIVPSYGVVPCGVCAYLRVSTRLYLFVLCREMRCDVWRGDLTDELCVWCEDAWTAGPRARGVTVLLSRQKLSSDCNHRIMFHMS